MHKLTISTNSYIALTNEKIKIINMEPKMSKQKDEDNNIATIMTMYTSKKKT